MNKIDILFILANFCIWFLLFLNIVLTYKGYQFYQSIINREKYIKKELTHYPYVSILIPAHNEEKVIEKTVLSMMKFKYPKDRYEVIVVNDHSSDDTENILERIKKHYPNRLNIFNVPKGQGGRGKSNALNQGLKIAKGEYICVYDADNTPNEWALFYLVYEITTHPKYGAVIGKFRTRNKEKNLLTKFINLETLTFQWMAQAGRWHMLKLCTIPGTNFIIRKDLLYALGGWDIDAIAEDTEISFRIYNKGYLIAFMPLAETYEQEPETLRVWFKQRGRWVEGNLYVLKKYLLKWFQTKNKKIFFDIVYFFSVYVTFLSAVILSDLLLVILIFTDLRLTFTYDFKWFWMLSYLIFILQVNMSLSFEKGEGYLKNTLLIFLMYFTYCQMWVMVSVKSMIKKIFYSVFKKEIKWYKTERF